MPFGFVTVIFPVVAPTGTDVLIRVGLTIVKLAFTPFNSTSVTSAKLVPTRVTLVPIVPDGGLNDLIVGTPAGTVVVVVGPVVVVVVGLVVVVVGGLVVVVGGAVVVGGEVGGDVGGDVGGEVGGDVGGIVGTLLITTVGGGIVGGVAGLIVVGETVASGVVAGRTVVGGVVGRELAVEIAAGSLSPPLTATATPMTSANVPAPAPITINIWFFVTARPACRVVWHVSLAQWRRQLMAREGAEHLCGGIVQMGHLTA